MQLWSNLLIALALAIDAFSISILIGTTRQKTIWREGLKIAGYFGLFQLGMTLVGWWGGTFFQSTIESIDHWLASGLLFVIGLKMIIDVLRSQEQQSFSLLSHRLLLLLGITTSIDALGVGLSYALVNNAILWPAILIGLVAFVLSLTGYRLGQLFGRLIKNHAGILAGIILIGLGVKILLDHGALG